MSEKVDLFVVQIRDTKREAWRTVIEDGIHSVAIRTTPDGARRLLDECERKHKRIVRILGEVVE